MTAHVLDHEHAGDDVFELLGRENDRIPGRGGRVFGPGSSHAEPLGDVFERPAPAGVRGRLTASGGVPRAPQAPARGGQLASTETTLEVAVEGVAATPWRMDQRSRRTVRAVFGDAGKVRSFLERGRSEVVSVEVLEPPPPPPAPPPRSELQARARALAGFLASTPRPF